MKRVDIINGANLNTLGYRETNIYGKSSLDSINKRCIELGKELNIDIKIYQSNIEGEIVNHIQSLYQKTNGILINAGAYTHYSIAIRDALISVDVPFIEVHISNIFSREEFRRHSVLSDVAYGVISGFGGESYYLGIRAIKNIL
jgi:3-dehydroquinate dehydratase II